MTNAELRAELARQQAENQALRAQAAALSAVSGALPFAVEGLLGYLLEDEYTAVVLADADQRVQWVNKGFTRMCGLELAEVLGQKPESFLRAHLCDEPMLEYIQESIRRGQPFQYEVTNPHRGANSWLRVTVRPVLEANTGNVSFLGLLEDVTEWKQEQLAYAESERRFRNLAENVPGVLYEWRRFHSGAYQFDYVSPKVLELFGIRPEELSRMTDFIHPDELEGFLQNMDYATRHYASWTYEGRVVVPGQPVRWMQGKASVTGTGPDWVKYSGILLDITPVKLAESALRESNLRLGLAMEGFGDGAWELNLHTHEVLFSLEYKAMLGYDNESFPNEYERWVAHVHPDDLARVREAVRAYVQGKTATAVAEYRIRCRNGSYKWVLSRAIISGHDTAGQPLLLSGLQSDISALKQAREDLDASTQQLATVIGNFREGLVLEDENRHIVFTNEAFAQLLPMPAPLAPPTGQDGAWLTQHTRPYVQNPNRYQARITALLHRRQPVTGDVIALCDGRTLQRDYTPIFDGARYIGQLWKFADITARTRAEDALKRREEKYRGIIENMSLGLVEADLEDHLLYANQSFCEMTGFCNEELQGQRLSPLLLSGDDLALVESKMQSRQEGVADSYEIKVTTKTGQPKWLLVSGAPLYDGQHRHVGSIGIYLDVTPQKQLEGSLREAKAVAETSTQAKQRFLTNMSHEIRTPMNAILGMSHLLEKTTLDATQASYLHAIAASADTLLVVINDILDSAKIEAGRLSVEHIGFDPVGLCQQVEKTLRYRAEEKGLLFETLLDPTLPAVLFSDPHRIAQVLLNLTGNAIKFTEEGHVRLICTLLGQPAPHEALVEFVVEDSGVGIEADYLEQIFEEFSQEDSSVSRQFGGTGLGLSISQKLVALLGGHLQLESRKHKGTRSRFTLRLAVGHPQSLAQKQCDNLDYLHQALHGKRLLLVEDNVFNRLLATVFLNNAGIEVHEAANGQVAVEMARTHRYDLILMDVQMPVQNGYQATAQMRQSLGLATPIVALTANAIVGERGKCLAAGMNDYLTKPFEEITLLKMVHQWVVGAQPDQAAAPIN
ncbi:PAS domain S-box protein [Hymenobacter glaciei]